MKFTNFPVRYVAYKPYTYSQYIEMFTEPIWGASFSQNVLLVLENAQGPKLFQENYRIINELYSVL
jgi:hypothetical protein